VKRKKIIISLLLLILVNMVHSQKIFEVDNFYLKQAKTIIVEPISFFVTDKDYVFIMDRKASNIKIYSKKGKFIKVLGRKGVGPNEFLNLLCFTSYKDELLIYDIRRRALFLYKIDRQLRFMENKKIKFESFITEMQYIDKDKVLMTGEEFDSFDRKTRKSYTLFVYNVKRKTKKLLLPATIAYGVKNQKEANDFFLNTIGLMPIGSSSSFSQKYFFYVLSTKIRIVRLSKKQNKVFVFGKRSKNFISPYISKEIREAIKRRNLNMLNEKVKKMSFVIKLFYIGNNKVGLLFTKYDSLRNRQDIYIQIYNSINGNIIKEIKLIKTESEYVDDLKAYYKRETKSLYILETVSAGFSDQKFKLRKFKITDK